MKILIFNWRCPKHPEAGGAEKYLYEISKRLIKKGHKIVWFSASFNGAKEVDNLEGIEIIRMGGRYTVYAYAFIYFLKKFKKEKFDIIIDDINGVPFFSPFYVKIPKLAIIHHLMKKQFFKELPFFLAMIGYFIERSIPFFYSQTSFITVSNSSKEELSKIGIKNITIVPNGIDLTCCHSKLDKYNIPTVLFLGRLKKYKRIDLLLRAFTVVSEKIKNVNLWIAGDGDHRAALEELATKLNLQNITFWGYVDEKEKKELLQKAWVLVMPSLKEGWGITVIEANICGTPCIAYDVPGLRDSIKDGETGILVRKDGNVKKLAEAIYEILTNNKLRKKLSQNAIEWAKQFSWDKSAEEFEKVLERVVNNG